MPTRASFRCLLSLSLWFVLAAYSEARAQGAAPPAPPPPAVTVVTLKSESVTLTRELPGRTNPYRVAEVRPQVSGIIKGQLFTEGKLVKAGQPLYQLDDETYQADVNSAKASLARAQAKLEAARLTAKRASELVKANAVSKQEAEDATAALRQAEADVKVGQAAVESAEIILKRARISAPIDGRIGKSAVTQGALVTANQTAPLATIQQLDPIYVDLTQSSSEILQIRKEVAAGNLASTTNLPVTILLEDGAKYAQRGRLAFSEVTVDPSTGSTAIRVIVPNPNDLLLPGMYVRAVVSTGRRDNALLAPQQGVTRDPKGNASALIVNAEGKVEVRPVKVSRALGDKWLVEEGLKAGDRVIVEGVMKVKPDMPVQATEAGPPPVANTPLIMPPKPAGPPQ
ncbi:component of acridine efflux pump [Candidatus Competibacter denitrificans Run_A_D11]|uniref:Component of acridine efflux pump n=1 Tax=Candidatus Competibacter denitrificans Run_A_D11 TaxID=1400863 RepID=W6M9R1_9GAMM|nr:efflux RND transporter periplasmic adaptor subunit [Candidatus Competibacter denitrificans]CDI02515.1 component of acridine efflux pump [Candidatus Competibacter denitrificans Run_A_D11]